jgi:hypothetical protein
MKLTPEQLVVREKFARQIAGNPQSYFDRYRARFDKILDTDNARELSEDYGRSKESRARYGSAVHGPAGDLVWRLYLAMLAEEDPRESRSVLITAGGAGSGKTSTVRVLLQKAYDSARVIYDTTLADLPQAIEKVEAALLAGRQVTIIYIHRPIDKAARGVVRRALEQGRTTPLSAVADNHFDAQRTVLELARRYKSDPRVEIQVINNGGDFEEASLGSLDFLRKRLYKKREAVRKRAARAARVEFRSLKRRGVEVPEYIYEAIIEEK